ncbi:hypothetical protein B0H17DRAFT_1125104 [Mycena rosella]|uniref:Uncharacterized protein n=1 Tax=Mycena rosella TaxID=1033263 RepID=A0AAD7MAK0_MYCRO|nr:hypothetical protein B0H17DRAFT_1125104 [Mycena rosella]
MHAIWGNDTHPTKTPIKKTADNATAAAHTLWGVSGYSFNEMQDSRYWVTNRLGKQEAAPNLFDGLQPHPNRLRSACTHALLPMSECELYPPACPLPMHLTEHDPHHLRIMTGTSTYTSSESLMSLGDRRPGRSQCRGSWESFATRGGSVVGWVPLAVGHSTVQGRDRTKYPPKGWTQMLCMSMLSMFAAITGAVLLLPAKTPNDDELTHKPSMGRAVRV